MPVLGFRLLMLALGDLSQSLQPDGCIKPYGDTEVTENKCADIPLHELNAIVSHPRARTIELF